jgi:hypothetical protein
MVRAAGPLSPPMPAVRRLSSLASPIFVSGLGQPAYPFPGSGVVSARSRMPSSMRRIIG